MSEPRFVSGADALASWRDELLSGTPPTLYPVGVGALATVQVGPQLVTLLGGAPGAGKTALAMQMVFDALRITQSLRVVVCNVEMSPGELLNRQLARIGGVDLAAIRKRQLTAEHGERIDAAMATVEPLAERMAFVRPPFTLENAAAVADEFDAGLLVLDYIQRITPPGNHDNTRSSVNATMGFLREFADAGTAVLAIAAVGRTRDQLGRSTYNADALNLASFKESGELEYGADSAYLLAPIDNSDVVALRCLKNRNGDPQDVPLRFHRHCQRFEPVDTPSGRKRRGQRADAARDEEEAF